MKSQQCPSCHEEDSIIYFPDFAGDVCQSCGFVLTENGVEATSTLSEAPQETAIVSQSLSSRHQGSGQIQLTRSAETDPQRGAFKKLTILCSQLGLSPTFQTQSQNLLRRVIDYYKYVIKGYPLWVAACVYIISRQTGKPLTLVDICQAAEVDLLSLRKVYIRLLCLLNISLELVDPSIYLDRYLSQILKEFPSFFQQPSSPSQNPSHPNSLSLNSSTLQTFQERVEFQDFYNQILLDATRLLCLAKDYWIDSGRRRDGLAAGALLLSLQIHQKNITAKQLSSVLGLTYRTVNVRFNELKEIMIEYGKKKMPWGKDITKTNICLHAPVILKLLDCTRSLSNDSTQSSPSPSSPQLLTALSLIPAPAAPPPPVPLTSCNSVSEFLNHIQGNESKTQNHDVDGKKSNFGDDGSLLSLYPPSFKANESKRIRRREKLERAKRRLSSLLSPSASQCEGDLKSGSETECSLIQYGEDSSNPGKRTLLDEEDLIFEKLLLEGHSDQAILDRFSQASTPPLTSLYPSLVGQSSEELDDKDIPESELGQFIRTPNEILRLIQTTKSQLEAEKNISANDQTVILDANVRERDEEVILDQNEPSEMERSRKRVRDESETILASLAAALEFPRYVSDSSSLTASSSLPKRLRRNETPTETEGETEVEFNYSSMFSSPLLSKNFNCELLF